MALEEPKELSPLERERLRLSQEQAKDVLLAASLGDDEGLRASFAALRQLATQVDLEEFLNSLHVPEDAGQWEEGLRRILLRIPDGWGRWISCGPGWYPLLVELDEAIAALIPDYEVHQAKEKYSGLRYYWGASGPQDPDDPEPAPRFRRKPQEQRTEEEEVDFQRYLKEHKAWRERYSAWRETPEGQAALAEAERLSKLVDELVDAAEARSYQICELCGQPGSSTRTLSASPWYQTLCPAHAEERGFVDQETWDAWWAEYEPTYRAETREYRIKQYRGKRILVACADERIRLLDELAATYARTPEEVERLLAEEWDKVFFDDLDCGRRVEEVLVARYQGYAAEALKKQREERRMENVNLLHAPGAPETAMVGYFQGLGHLRVGVRVTSPFDEIYADEEGYRAFYAEQRERETRRREEKDALK